MEFRKVLALRGPNVWARFPVLEVWVDLGDLKDSPSDEIPGFNDRLMAWLPTMIEHRCSVGERGGFFERLRRGTYLAHILEHVTLELQELAGTPVGFGRARETTEEGVYKVAIQYREEKLARACLKEARELCLAAVYDRPYDVEAALARLRDVSYFACLGPSTSAIVEAARARDIPVRRLNDENLVQLGHGVKQRRILTAETDRTGAIAESIASDKALTRTLLQAVGVPVAEGRPVESAEDAWEAAQEIGGPVVVKPRDANHGRGVSIHLTTREQVTAAYDDALLRSDGVLVERYAPGDDHRLLVVGGRLVAAARRVSPSVVGDGRSTVTQLVHEVNRDPLRSADGHLTPLFHIKLNDAAREVLAEQGHAFDSVPKASERVYIHRKVNFFTGGTAVDVTERVHPEVAARAVDAARVIGLDIAGLDVLAQDIARPLEEQGGVVAEVNAGPGLQMHLPPSAPPRPVGEAIVAQMFPPGETGRIPIAAVTGVNGKTTTARLIAHIVRGTGLRVGLTSTDGIYVDGRRTVAWDCSGPKSARDVLLNPSVEAAVFEVARGGILREGLGFDRCDVAVVTNIGEGDHLGMSWIDTPEQLAMVKSTVVEAVRPGGMAVLNAADPLTAAMAECCRGSVCYFARDPGHPVLTEHRARSGRAALVRDGRIILAEGSRETPLVPLDRVPLTHGGRVGFQVENALAAAAAAWGLGLSLETIARGLESFSNDLERTPGRFNVLEARGATIVLDYGHNPDAVAALVAAIESFPSRRRTVVYSADGDRQDDVIVRQAQRLAGAFDRVILYEEEYRRRGRAPGEIYALLRRGLAGAARVSEVVEIDGEQAAIEAGLRSLGAGELVLIQVDAVDADLEFVRRLLAELA